MHERQGVPLAVAGILRPDEATNRHSEDREAYGEAARRTVRLHHDRTL